jgi:acylphosphatase
MRTVRVVVTGRVQGVGFRAFVLREAHELGLTGWVRNHPNGDVEAEAMGDEAALERFVEAMRSGPHGAQVMHVAVQWSDAAPAGSGFHVVR